MKHSLVRKKIIHNDHEEIWFKEKYFNRKCNIATYTVTQMTFHFCRNVLQNRVIIKDEKDWKTVIGFR